MKPASLLLAASILLSFTFSHAQTTRERQAELTPDAVLESLMAGNARFVEGKPSEPEITTRRAAVVQGQHPKAVILSCLDSRVPVELVFDMGIGDLFVGRVAGNVQDSDQLGSMEFATKLAGAKVVMVLGHSRCGAVVGAINKAELGHLTALLAKIRPAAEAVEGFEPEERTAGNPEFVQATIEENVRQTVAGIREQSPVLAGLEKSGDIKIVGGLYDLETGKVTLLD